MKGRRLKTLRNAMHLSVFITLRAAIKLRGLCALLFAISVPSSAIAQVPQNVKIVQRVWGFDGRVVSGQFMPLSIEIDNLSDEPIEAMATLRSVAGMLRETGGTSIQPVFLGPHSRRWVQFYPFIAGQSTSWQFELQKMPVP